MGELALKNDKLIEEEKIVVNLILDFFKIKVRCLKKLEITYYHH